MRSDSGGRWARTPVAVLRRNSHDMLGATGLAEAASSSRRLGAAGRATDFGAKQSRAGRGPCRRGGATSDRRSMASFRPAFVIQRASHRRRRASSFARKARPPGQPARGGLRAPTNSLTFRALRGSRRGRREAPRTRKQVSGPGRLVLPLILRCGDDGFSRVVVADRFAFGASHFPADFAVAEAAAGSRLAFVQARVPCLSALGAVWAR